MHINGLKDSKKGTQVFLMIHTLGSLKFRCAEVADHISNMHVGNGVQVLTSSVKPVRARPPHITVP
jgi:hypothetical protein